jgi:hypothetical protein
VSAARSRRLNSRLAWESLPSLLDGLAAGVALANRLSQARFGRLVLGFLVVMALLAIGGALR